ncbi:horcolin-like [Amaranthus tricolor]|uniref:horcolin-like n=1 Tax=Amaranthus tricolor TaxID=29722 RepID=UPI00258272C5|nr:horcolin-like [Amaranthus tricolor]XP_057529516.1 horcolin-like [Amaranthus tricolor]
MAQAVVKKQVIEQYGPYGSQLPENYRFQLAEGEKFCQVTVRHGYIVDAIGFKVAKPDGSTYSVSFGGNGGQESKIDFVDGEYLIGVSGTYGNYQDQKDQCLIATLKIHTNLNPNGYGPYGQGKDVTNVQKFNSPMLIDGPMVGVFGRHNNYLESLGVLIRKEFPN